jgi:hypothetical protein
VNGDVRGWRVALLPDTLVNPPHPHVPAHPLVVPGLDVLGAMEVNGYGVLQLPPPGQHGLLLAVIADQVAEYAHHGYAVVAIGVRGILGDGLHWRRLAPLLRHRGVALPPRHVIRPNVDGALEEQRLAEFLAGYDLPEEERRRWRV